MPHSKFSSPKNIALFTMLVLAIVAIAWIAMWGARNAPVTGASSVFPRDDLVLRFYPTDKSLLVYATNLKTGKSVSRTFPGDHFQQCGWDDSKFWVINQSADQKRVLRHQWNFDDDLPISTTVFPFQMEAYRRYHNRIVIVGNKIICVRLDQLESYDPITGQLLDSLTLTSPDSSPYASSWLFPELPPNRLLLSQARRTRYCELFDVRDDGHLESIANWTAIDSYTFRQDDTCYIASLLPGGLTIEVRDASNGELVSSTTVPTDPTLPVSQTLTYEKGAWIGFPICSVERDIFNGRELPVPRLFDLLVRDTKNKRLVAICKTLQTDLQRTVVVMDEATGVELVKFPVDANCSKAKILSSSNQLLLTTFDLRSYIFDIQTGQLVRTIDPYKLVRWSRTGGGIAFLLWCVLWMRFASTIHSFAWMDIAVCIALFSAYETYCSYHDVTFPFPSFLFLMGIGGLFGVVFLNCIWVVLGRTRFLARLMPLLLSFGLAEGLVVWWVPANRTESIEANLVPVIGIATLICIVALLPLRWLGVRFARAESAIVAEQMPATQRQTRIELRDIFFMTIVCAISLSIFRCIPLTHWYEILYFDLSNLKARYASERVKYIMGAGIFSGLFFCLGIFGLWISMSRRRYDWICGLVASSFVVMTYKHYVPYIWMPVVIAAGGAYVTSLLGFYAYRLRGWRFAEKRV